MSAIATSMRPVMGSARTSQPEHHRDHRVHVRVRADDRRGGVLERIAERGVADDGPEDDQIGHRAEAGGIQMESRPFPDRQAEHAQERARDRHLQAAAAYGLTSVVGCRFQ